MPKATLMQHQAEGVKFLDDLDGVAALLWDPGVGKTGATLSWIDKMAARLGGFRVLVVAPLTAVDTWVLQPPLFMDSLVKARVVQGTTVQILEKIAQANDWSAVPDAKIQTNHQGPRLNQRVTIMSVSAGAISSYCTERTKTIRAIRAIRKYDPDLIVLDESQIAKAPTSNISTAMYQMGQLAQHRVILTGTVNPHSILDCFGQWRFLAPWTFSEQANEPFVKEPLLMTRAQKASIRPWTWGQFKTFYAKPGGHKGKGIGGFQHELDLHERVAARSMVVKAEDALDLPPSTDVDIHVALSPAEMKAYREMADDLATMIESGEILEAVNALSKYMKLRQIAAGFIRDTDNDITYEIGNSLRKGVIEVATTQLEAEERLVVTGYFRPECASLVEMLRKAENKAGRKDTIIETITGATKGKERLAIRQRFGDVSRNPQRTILVGQARAISLSINELTTSRHLINGSLSERRDDWVQLRRRVLRKGQTRPVTFWNVFTPGLVGEIMRDNHKNRGDLEQAMLDHILLTAKKR